MHAANQLVLVVLGIYVFGQQIDTFFSFDFEFKLSKFRRWDLWRSGIVARGKKLRALVSCRPDLSDFVDTVITLIRFID